MNDVVPAVKLHLNKREITFAVPLYITAMVALISVVIAVLFWRSGSTPGTEGWIQGSRNNPGVAQALGGFLAYLGVQSVATTFPFALTLGATRRAFTLGTLAWAAITSAYLTAVFAVLLTLEKATGHWFAGFYIFDVHILGSGDLTRLIPIVFLTSLTLLTVGGAFAASWVRFGARGPQALGVVVFLVVVAVLAVAVPSADVILSAFELWWLAILALVVVASSATGTWLLLRSAAVR